MKMVLLSFQVGQADVLLIFGLCFVLCDTAGIGIIHDVLELNALGTLPQSDGQVLA